MMPGQLNVNMQKNEVGPRPPHFILYPKYDSKWITVLNVRDKTKKLRERKEK